MTVESRNYKIYRKFCLSYTFEIAFTLSLFLENKKEIIIFTTISAKCATPIKKNILLVTASYSTDHATYCTHLLSINLPEHNANSISMHNCSHFTSKVRHMNLSIIYIKNIDLCSIYIPFALWAQLLICHSAGLH